MIAVVGPPRYSQYRDEPGLDQIVELDRLRQPVLQMAGKAFHNRRVAPDQRGFVEIDAIDCGGVPRRSGRSRTGRHRRRGKR